MSEMLLGYFEAAFLVLAVVLIMRIVTRVFAPERREEMERYGRMPFAEEDGDGRA